MVDCEKCDVYPCFIVKCNKGKPYAHCLGYINGNDIDYKEQVLQKIKDNI